MANKILWQNFEQIRQLTII